MKQALSSLFHAGISLRHWLYDRGWLAQKRAALPVISIGNLLAGGTGKTPLVLFLAKRFYQAGYHPIILSRGYKRRRCIREPFVVNSSFHSPEDTGDEPWMLASHLPPDSVIVGKNRWEGGCLAQKKGADLLLLDDGMQHRQLKRDIEIVVLHASHLLGEGKYLPWGKLREDPNRLKHADYVVIHGSSSPQIQKTLEPLTSAPIVEMKTVPQEARDMNGKPLSLKGVPVGIFCGIGHPEGFIKTVTDLGAQIVYSLFLSDHQKMSKKALKACADETRKRGGKWLLCTEKDKVKLFCERATSLDIGWVPTEVKLGANAELLDKIFKL